MNFEDFIVDLFEERRGAFENMYGRMTPNQRRIADEILLSHELSDEEFEELIEDPKYFKGQE